MNALAPFDYQGAPLRVVVLAAGPWFVGQPQVQPAQKRGGPGDGR